MEEKVRMFALVLLALLQPGTMKIDKDSRAAFIALRDFQKLESTAFTSQSRWPTGEQHMYIISKLDDAYDAIKISLSLRQSPQVSSMMNNALRSVKLIDAALNAPPTDQPIAPDNVKKAMTKAVVAYTKFINNFPPVSVSDEKLTR
jgi:hypothetical protein